MLKFKLNCSSTSKKLYLAYWKYDSFEYSICSLEETNRRRTIFQIFWNFISFWDTYSISVFSHSPTLCVSLCTEREKVLSPYVSICVSGHPLRILIWLADPFFFRLKASAWYVCWVTPSEFWFGWQIHSLCCSLCVCVCVWIMIHSVCAYYTVITHSMRESQISMDITNNDSLSVLLSLCVCVCLDNDS